MMYCVSNELSHYGVRGMKWGIRKQRPMVIGRSRSKSYESADQQKAARRARAKRAAKIGAGVAVGILAAYGGYKIYKLRGASIDALSKSYIESGKKYIRAGYKGRKTASYIMNNADKAKLRGSYDTMRLQSELGKYTHKMADNDINTGLNYINKGNNKDFTRREVASEMINQVKKRKR